MTLTGCSQMLVVSVSLKKNESNKLLILNRLASSLNLLHQLNVQYVQHSSHQNNCITLQTVTLYTKPGEHDLFFKKDTVKHCLFVGNLFPFYLWLNQNQKCKIQAMHNVLFLLMGTIMFWKFGYWQSTKIGSVTQITYINIHYPKRMFCVDLKKIIDFYYLIGGNCVEIKQLYICCCTCLLLKCYPVY